MYKEVTHHSLKHLFKGHGTDGKGQWLRVSLITLQKEACTQYIE